MIRMLRWIEGDIAEGKIGLAKKRLRSYLKLLPEGSRSFVKNYFSYVLKNRREVEASYTKKDFKLSEAYVGERLQTWRSRRSSLALSSALKLKCEG